MAISLYPTPDPPSNKKGLPLPRAEVAKERRKYDKRNKGQGRNGPQQNTGNEVDYQE